MNTAYQCAICGDYFETRGGLSAHLSRSEPEHGGHGNETTYRRRRRCGCEECRSVHALEMRLHRSSNGYPKTLEDCLRVCGKAAGIPTGKILAALATHSVYALHWGAWRQSGEFRTRCHCDVPDEVKESFEDVGVW